MASKDNARCGMGRATTGQIVRSIVCGVCFLYGHRAVTAQVAPPPPPVPSSATAPAPAPASTTNPGTYQLKVNVTRVILDVVVTDAKGRPVDGLKQDDFTVFEDGVAQPVRAFDAHTPAPTSAGTQPALHLPPNTFSSLAVVPSDKPITILLYDMLNTPQSALPYAHAELVKFIKDRKISTSIAIFALTDRLHMLQGFTDDETRLMAAVDSKTLRSHTSQLLTADTAADQTALLAPDPAADTSATQPVVQVTTADSVLALLSDAVKGEQEFQDANRIETTVDAFANIARFVAALPGRKNLIWMSGSFPVELWPGRKPTSAGSGDYNIASRFDSEIKEAQQVLKDGRVAIYPVDVRGLKADPQFGLATSAPRLPARVPIGGGGPPPPPSFGIQTGAEHATMDAIAESSGGRAFYDTNGLQEAMESAVRQGTSYYTLTYAPTNGKEDGGERKVKVVLKEPRYQLSYRERYLALDAAHPTPLRSLAQDMNMQHGAPGSSELFFEAGVVPVGTAMAASPAEMEGLKMFLQNNARGKRSKLVGDQEKVQHYDINLAIIGRQLEMPLIGEGKYATSMRFGLAAYTEDSELLNGTEISVKNALPTAQYQKIVSEGYHASMVFAVPLQAVSLRIAVRDEIGNRIGTIEVPLPLTAPKSVSPAEAKSK